MSDTYDLLIKGGTLVNQDGVISADIGVRSGRIAEIGSIGPDQAGDVIDGTGLHVLPGVVDTQVHFREPGAEQKEDLESGSRAAVMGGVTGVFEMPNTNPTTTDTAALEDKVARATDRMFCDFAFYVGATRENIDELPELERQPAAAGVKVFIGSSTGDLLVDDEASLAQILAKISRRAAFHSEDEARLISRLDHRVENDPASHPVWRDPEAAMISTQRLVRLARETSARVHVLHISTWQEMQFLKDHKDVATVEATPHHLTLVAPEAYERLGTLAQMNPPVRDAEHNRGIWWGLQSGVVDVIGSDHAPHTREEKAVPYPASPSGMPGVQTLVPVMLDHVNAGRLSLERFVDLTSHGPQRLFGMAGKGRIAVGYDADFTVVDMKAERVIEESWMESRSNWTPYEGRSIRGWPVGTIIRGRRVMWDGEIATPAGGRPIRFSETMGA